MAVFMKDLGGRVVFYKRASAIHLSVTDPHAHGSVVKQSSPASYEISINDARDIITNPRLLLTFLPPNVHFNADERQEVVRLLKGWLPSWARVPSSAEFRVGSSALIPTPYVTIPTPHSSAPPSDSRTANVP
ncbi:MAG TPA: hypothetical protein VKX17_18775 [Planctomycetota bacterium]|nr:hypothetical protein [Planctomycetota bacterium]